MYAEREYIKGKGVYVGTFTKDDIDKAADIVAIAQAAEETGLGYVNTEIIRKNGSPFSLRVYVCTLEDMEL